MNHSMERTRKRQTVTPETEEERELDVQLSASLLKVSTSIVVLTCFYTL